MNRPNLWIALDVPTEAEAERLIAQFQPHRQFKVGLELFTGVGPHGVRRWVDRGLQIFLDLKLHDIPTTVGRALTQIKQLGAALTTVHASGGSAMLEEAHNMGETAVVAVTLLTSMGDDDLTRLGWGSSAPMLVSRLTSLAQSNGLSGIVTSAAEVEHVKQLWPDARIVVPGLRWGDRDADDHAHVLDPYHAWRLGATDLVIGRSLTEASDPGQAYHTLLTHFKENADAVGS